MEEQALSTQLGRIETIQAHLRTLLLEDSADGLDELLEEKRSRLRTVLEQRETAAFSTPRVYQRLLGILRGDHELQELITRQLAVLSTEMRKTQQAQQLTGAYLAAPARAAGALALTDVSV